MTMKPSSRRTILGTMLATGSAPLLASAGRAKTSTAYATASQIDPPHPEASWAEQNVTLTQFGVTGDLSSVSDPVAATDITDAWHRAMEHMQSIGGGTLWLPHGMMKASAPLHVPGDVAITVRGTGQRKNYPSRSPYSPIVAGQALPSTIVPIHSGRATFLMKAEFDGQGGAAFEDMNVATLGVGEVPDAAFAWDYSVGFWYGATFRSIGIHGFKKTGSGSAFDIFDSSSGKGRGSAVGAVTIQNCNINFNNWICRALSSKGGNGYFNVFRFLDNNAGKNGYAVGTGGLALRGNGLTVERNILEENRDAIRVTGAGADIEISNNYFEANPGDAVIYVREHLGVRIGPNVWTDYDRTLAPKHKVHLVGCINVDCLDNYWGDLVYNATAPHNGNRHSIDLNNDATNDWSRIDSFDGRSWGAPPQFKSLYASRMQTNYIRELNPQGGKVMSASRFTTGYNEVRARRLALTGAPKDWLVLTFAMKRIDGSDLDPSLEVNIGSGRQEKFKILSYYQSCVRPGEWALVTYAMKLTVPLYSDLDVELFPYSKDASEGLDTVVMWPPVAYVIDDINKAKPWFSEKYSGEVDRPPISGEWFEGDRMDLTSGGYCYCSAGGSPGIWQTRE